MWTSSAARPYREARGNGWHLTRRCDRPPLTAGGWRDRYSAAVRPRHRPFPVRQGGGAARLDEPVLLLGDARRLRRRDVRDGGLPHLLPGGPAGREIEPP